MHYRWIRREQHGCFGDSFRVACGADVKWTMFTTSDITQVDCKRCLKKIELIKKEVKP
jgi:hypothetical protein